MKLTDTLCLKIMKRARKLATNPAIADLLSWDNWPQEARWFSTSVAELIKAGHTQRGSFRAVLAIYNEYRTFDEPLPQSITDLAQVKPLAHHGIRNALFTDEGRGSDEDSLTSLPDGED